VKALYCLQAFQLRRADAVENGIAAWNEQFRWLLRCMHAVLLSNVKDEQKGTENRTLRNTTGEGLQLGCAILILDLANHRINALQCTVL